MLVLGIDPGLAITGYGLVDETEGELGLVRYGVITTPAGMALPERLCMMYEQLQEVVTEHRPDIAAVEQLFFAKNAKTAMLVGQARGVILLTLSLSDVPLFEYTPLQIKQALAGYGRATKNQVQRMVQMVLGLDDIPTPDDAADAVATAICHLQSARMSELASCQEIEEGRNP